MFLLGLNKGSVLIFTLAVLTAILTMAIAGSAFLVKQAKINRNLPYSAPAYYAAESGIECMLYQTIIKSESQGNAKNYCNEASRSKLNDAVYAVELGNAGWIKSTGTYGSLQRSIQIYIE